MSRGETLTSGRIGVFTGVFSLVGGVNDQADFAPDGTWQDFCFAFPDFRPPFRGQPAV